MTPTVLRQWEQQQDKFAYATKEKKRGHKKTLHSGRPGILKPHEDTILEWFVNMRLEGKIVTYRMVGHYICGLSRVFKRKSADARLMCLRRFLRTHRVVLRSLTNEAQQAPETVRAIVEDFVDVMHPDRLSVLPMKSIVIK